jgi:MFS family permease
LNALRTGAIATGVAIVLSDSSIVVLALPEIFREFNTTVEGVSWVLISFNLALALAAVPGALAARRLGPGRTAALGLAVFAGGSLACGLATGLGPLLAGRVVQAIGGALAVTASLELLIAARGSERRGIAFWVGAGAIGAALGPGIGGFLTELVSWQSIFLVQVPVALMVAALLGPSALGETREWKAPGSGDFPDRKPHLPANLALALVSAGIAAALFLVVLLLIEGWLLTPIEAALAVTVLPVAALVGSRIGPRIPSIRMRAASGAILLAGGLASLGLLPGAEVAYVIPPQILSGLGLALVLSSLTEQALEGRADSSIHGGWTIASRHAGVVVGLLILTPVFTSQLEQQRTAALDAGTEILLESGIDPSRKLELGARLSDEIGEQPDRVPDLEGVFDPLPDDPVERDQVEDVLTGINDQLERAATHAFSLPFLLSSLFALAALLPIALSRRFDL